MATNRAFERVLVIMFENQYKSYVLQNPYMRSLADQGALLFRSFGCMHPSQTNYIAAVSGELCNITSDDAPTSPLPQRTIVDLMEEAGLSWAAYMQAYRPGKTPWKADGFAPEDDFPYVIKHNPFSSYARITSSEERWKKVRNEADFFADVLGGTLPEFAWFTPDMWADGHYTTGTETSPRFRAPALVDQLAAWLRQFFAKLRFPGPDSLLPAGTLVVVTFDESDFESAFEHEQGWSSPYDGPNEIYTVLLGDMIAPGQVIEEEGYNHYSLLRTVEENFALGSLGKNDAGANWMRFLWGRRFAWGPAKPARLDGSGGLAATEHQGRLTVATVASDGIVLHRATDLGWQSSATGEACDGGIALASTGAALAVAWIAGRKLQARVGDVTATIDDDAVGDVAMVPISGARLLLAWQRSDGRICTAERDVKGAWGETEETCATTSGGLAMSVQGAVVHLTFTRADGSLRWLTRNLTDFNVVTVEQNKYGGPWDNTTKDAWSPCSFSIGSFAAVPDPATPGEPEPLRDGYTGSGPLASATLDGVVYLVHGAQRGLACTTMSIPGLLTPLKPVAYNTRFGEQGFSNGYGTAAQAGWSAQRSLPGDVGASRVAMARVGDRVALLTADASGTTLRWGADG